MDHPKGPIGYRHARSGRVTCPRCTLAKTSAHTLSLAARGALADLQPLNAHDKGRGGLLPPSCDDCGRTL